MSTSVFETLSYEALKELGTEGYVQSVESMDDPSEQLRALRPYAVSAIRGIGYYYPGTVGVPLQNNEKLYTELADFAASEMTSTSLLVRLSALERALEMGYGFQDMRQLPNLGHVRSGAQDVHMQSDTDDATHAGRSYRYIAKTIGAAEHVDMRVLFPDESEYEIDRGYPDPDLNPVLCFAFLDKAMADVSAGKQSDAFTKFSPLIEEMQSKLVAANSLPSDISVEFKFWEDVSNGTKLLSYGENYQGVFVEILRSQDKDAFASIRKIGELYERASYVYMAFPKRYRTGVKEGVQHILADAFYAVLDHTKNGGRTDTAIQLSQGSKGLPLKLQDREPYELLDALWTSFETMGRVRLNLSDWSGCFKPSFRNTLKVAESDQYGLYRYMDYQAPSNLSVYVRPYGSADYDPFLEYGRPREGVEASISFVVDTAKPDGTVLEVGKHRRGGDDKRISIRLDREGVAPGQKGKGVSRNPLQQEGTLSLDVGSVLGKDEWLSTKVGRFLAWGNTLRTQHMGTEAHLNHMTDCFTPEDGDADVFANEAIDMLIELEKERLASKEVAELFAGRAAVGATK